jgi:REP element-mobilizing transposase RayT
VHVSLKVVPEVGRLRKPKAYRALRAAAARVLGRGDFRIVHVSIQHNHVHLLVEADDRMALARGMQAFETAAARRLNRALGRARGKVFLHRYHATMLTTPKQVRHCLSYVLNNWRRHREDLRGAAQRRAHLDPYSTAIRFDGWLGVDGTFPIPDGYEPLPTSPPTVWLLTTGWRRHGPMDCREVPGPLQPEQPARLGARGR